jgi:hypothetical protein
VLALKAELGDTAAAATVELVDDPALGSHQVSAVGPWGPADQYDLLALAAEMGAPAGEATTNFADDPALGTFQLAAAAPFGPFDKQRVLVTQGSGARCTLLRELIGDQLELLQQSLGGDDDGPGDGPDSPGA